MIPKNNKNMDFLGYIVLKKINDLIVGAWDNIVINEDIYNEMQVVIMKYEKEYSDDHDCVVGHNREMEIYLEYHTGYLRSKEDTPLLSREKRMDTLWEIVMNRRYQVLYNQQQRLFALDLIGSIIRETDD